MNKFNKLTVFFSTWCENAKKNKKHSSIVIGIVPRDTGSPAEEKCSRIKHNQAKLHKLTFAMESSSQSIIYHQLQNFHSTYIDTRSVTQCSGSGEKLWSPDSHMTSHYDPPPTESTHGRPRNTSSLLASFKTREPSSPWPPMRETSPWPPTSVSHRMPLHSTSQVSPHKRGPPVAKRWKPCSQGTRLRRGGSWRRKQERVAHTTNTAYVPCQQVPLTINLPSMLYTLGNKSNGTRHVQNQDSM